jgi:hypothetical protein
MLDVRFWYLAAGFWLLVAGLLATGCWLPFAGFCAQIL